jgi:hypothetical protein
VQSGAASDRFAKFPAIGQYRAGERSAAFITSDGVTNVIRPKWTRAMGDLGGWPILYRFKGKIYLQYPHVDAHRGNRLEATGDQIQYVSSGEGKSWVRLEPPVPKANDVLTTDNTLLFFRQKEGMGTRLTAPVPWLVSAARSAPR